MLVDESVASEFLSVYKQLFWFLNASQEPENIEQYVKLRPSIYQERDKQKFKDVVGSEFITSLENAVFGKFVFLKKYQKGYVFHNIENEFYYQVYGLNSLIEDLVEEYSIIETAIIPFKNVLVCDGLIVEQGMTLGKNMAREIREGYWLAKRSGGLVVNV
jgi:hypothetical protein|tara:strand:+ start:405 stop:884 length:480 start_codon:yes stop_codon:yes gene_type:complete